MLGDFNSHSEAWGHPEVDLRGEDAEDWQIDNKLLLLNDPDDPPTFFTRRWLTPTTPDLVFATEDMSRKATWTVLSQLGGSGNKPVLMTLNLHYKPQAAKTFPRWNSKKADWKRFSNLTDQCATQYLSQETAPELGDKDLNQVILQAAKETILRGARRNYGPYWTEELQQMENEIAEARENTENNPRLENSIALKAATDKHRKVFVYEARWCWREKTEQLNLDKNSSKLWRLTKAMNDESSTSTPIMSQQNEELLTSKKAAGLLVNQYAETSDIQVSWNRKEDAKKAQQDYINTSGEPFDELTFYCGRTRHCPGYAATEKVSRPILDHKWDAASSWPRSKAETSTADKWSWRTGTVPHMWQEAIMAPVHKKWERQDKVWQLPSCQPDQLHGQAYRTPHEAPWNKRTHQHTAGCI